ncbi:MAG: methyltransferase [Nitratireductor sp.]|nr:methyltransferase [Nitratireductor sp.]
MDRGLPHGRAGWQDAETALNVGGITVAFDSETAKRFVLENTSVLTPPHVPEIRLRLADEAHALWLKTEEELERIGLPPPFWAFAWAGGQGLARHVLDHPELVRGKRVFDLATGSGLVAIAAKTAGATQVVANDVDPFCEAAVGLNSQVNAVSLRFDGNDFLASGSDLPQVDCVLAGDVFYDRMFSASAFAFLKRCADAGMRVLCGDPGRAYLPEDGLEKRAEYNIAVTRALEDSEVKHTCVWEVM